MRTKTYLFLIAIFMILIVPSLEAQSKKRLAILPFSGGEAQDGETISILLSNQRALLDTFTVQPRNSAIDRIMGEQQYQRQSGLINSDAISEIGKLNTADLVVSGHISKLSNTNLILISIIDVTEVQQVAGVYQTYKSIEEIRGLLPGLSQRLAEASRKSYQNLPGLAIPSFSVPPNVNANGAMVLAQVLATEIVSIGEYAVFPRNNSVDDVLREHQFQRSGQTSGAMALGTSRNIEYILASSVMGLGKTNLFGSQILNIEKGNVIAGADREYQDIADGMNKNLMRQIAGELLGVRVAAAAAPAPQSAPASNAPQSSDYLNLASAGWEHNTDSKSTVRFNVSRENIEGREREALNVDGTLGSGNPRWAEVYINDQTIIQKLTRSSGIRFKVLGDGKGWKLLLATKETSADSAYYRAAIATKKDRVVEIDIPYSKLRQSTSWGKKAVFNINNITGLHFGRNNESPGGATSTIKIFDIEIY